MIVFVFLHVSQLLSLAARTGRSVHELSAGCFSRQLARAAVTASPSGSAARDASRRPLSLLGIIVPRWCKAI